MRLSAAQLCDFAQVREGLLFVASSGISQIRRPEYPAPLTVSLALSFIVDGESAGSRPHTIRIRITDFEGQVELGTMQAEIGYELSGTRKPGSTDVAITHVVANLAAFQIPEPARYQVLIQVDSGDEVALPVEAVDISELVEA